MHAHVHSYVRMPGQLHVSTLTRGQGMTRIVMRHPLLVMAHRAVHWYSILC